MEFKAIVTRFSADVVIYSNHEVAGINQKVEETFEEICEVYPGMDPNQVKNDFIEKMATSIRSNNVMEINRIKAHPHKPSSRKMRVWVVTNME